MDDERAERVREWDSRSAGRGLAGLRELSGEGFSGAVEAGRTTALLTNGRVVWISGGDLDDLGGTALTAYEAPDDALPLLFAMQERGGETRAQYYTEDTSISEVNRTLEEGGFTGYIELSENVLSGDYYVVYHGGRSSSLAFVGNNRRLLAGDEAFERADDEVGIYEVVDATVDVIDLSGDGETDTARGSTTGSADGGGASAAPTDRGGSSADEAGADDEGPAASGTAADSADDPGDVDGTAPGGTDPGRDDTGQSPYGDEEIRVGAGLGTPDADGDASGSESGTDPGGAGADDAGSDIAPAEAIEDAGGEESTTGLGDHTPDASGAADDPGSAGTADAARGTDPDPTPERTPDGHGTADTTTSAGRVADLEAERDRLEAELADTRATLERVRDERDEHRDEAERFRERAEELEAEVERLEGEVEELEAEVEELEAVVKEPETSAEGPSLSPAEAIEGTNLFIRYRSKGEPTLEEVTGRGETDREAVNENLRIELHTTFETEGATVDERPFEAFLEDTLAYRFVQWVVRDLLYEVEATGNRQELEGLYEAIPEVDRIELGGEVRIGGSGSGDDAAETRTFDVVFRNRMSAPLAVADLHDSRDPASGDLVGTLIDDATAVARDSESIGGAFAVTTSYYEPPAHEAADEATGGGFLSRSNRKSYVKIDRTHGFHLCLVEARDGEFNLNVPEL